MSTQAFNAFMEEIERLHCHLAKYSQLLNYIKETTQPTLKKMVDEQDKVVFLEFYANLATFCNDSSSGSNYSQYLELPQAVNNFQIYFVEVLTEIYNSDPTALKFDQKEQLKLYDAIRKFFDNEINLLGKRGLFKQIEKWTDLKPENNASLQLAEKAFQVRHLITHHRGIINREFQRDFNLPESMIGKRYELSIEDTYEYFDALSGLLRNFDQKIVSKYRLSESLVEMR